MERGACNLGVIADDPEAHIWYSIAAANSNETAADNLRKINLRDVLSQSEIRAARKETAKRMEVIENREQGSASKYLFQFLQNQK